MGSCGRSPAHRRKWRRHQRRGRKPFVFNQPTPRFRGVIAVAATADKDLRAKLQTHVEQASSQPERKRAAP